MAKFDIQRVVSKGLHADNGYENTPNGLYGYAMNMRDATKNSTGVEKIRGNNLTITVPDVVQQKHIIRLRAIDFGRFVLTFKLGSVSTVASLNVLPTSNVNTGQENSLVSTLYLKIIQFFSNSDNPLQGVFTISYSEDGGYVEMQISPTSSAASAFNEFSPFFVLGGSQNLDVQVFQEALSDEIEGQTGELQPIGSIVLSNKLYIFSAISENELGGYGEIGFFETLTNTYTKLLGTKALNFTTLKQIDCDGETRDGEDYIYFTDNFNPVRAIHTQADFLEDINYGTIGDNILLTNININDANWSFNLGNGLNASFQSVVDTIGNIESGMYRYAVRFKPVVGTENIGNFSNLSGLIEIKSEEVAATGIQLGDGHNIFGDYETGLSKNVVNFSVSGVDNNKFKYADVLVVRYGGSVTGIATDGYIARNVSVTSSLFQFTHSDNSQLELLPIEEIIAILEDTVANINTAKNIRIANNRLLLSNVTKDNASDILKDWAKSIHIVDTLTSINALDLAWLKARPSNSVLHTDVGEYYDPTNRAQATGYMPFEEYRFGVQVKFKNGGWSDVFHIKDHRFDQGADTGPISAVNYIEFEFSETSSRKIKYTTTAQMAGHSFIKEGFVPGMYIAIQDEYHGQTVAQTQAYLSSGTTIPIVVSSGDGVHQLPPTIISNEDASWYINGNLTDFRRRIWYGNNGGATALGTPYFKIESVTDTTITLNSSIGNLFNDITHTVASGQTPDTRRRICSIYPPDSVGDKFNHMKYSGNHPMVKDGKVGVLVPKFLVDTNVVSEFISGYRIVRAPVIKEVLASGMCVVAENDRDCDAGLPYYQTSEEGKNYFYPTLTSNTWAQRYFTQGFAANDSAKNANKGSGLDSYISPIFNNATVNNNIETAYHIAGDGHTHKVTARRGHLASENTNTLDAVVSTNRPHPCVLSHGDFNTNYNGVNHDNTSEDQFITEDSDYTPHRYSGRNIVYFHAPDFDHTTSDGAKGFESDWKRYSSTDMLINLGRVYFGDRPIGPGQGSFIDEQGNQNGAGLATEEDPTVLKYRKILTANTGFPFLDVRESDVGLIDDSFAAEVFTGNQTTQTSEGDNVSSNAIVPAAQQEKSVDAQVFYCNRVPYIPMYGDASPLSYNAQGSGTIGYNPSMMQPGLQHNTFKHWTYYKIDDAEHTGSISQSDTNEDHPGRADTVGLHSSRLGKVYVHSSISYGSGNNHNGLSNTQNLNLLGLSDNTSYTNARRVDLPNTTSLPAMLTMLGDDTTADRKAMATCRTNKCMVMSVVNKHETPRTDEFGQAGAGAVQNSSIPRINQGEIGLTDGGGRSRTNADRGNKRVMAGENDFEKNIHHNWAGFADRGQNAQGIAPATTESNLGAYGWNKMADDTGMYMGLYFRQKSNYNNGDINHSGQKHWNETDSKYGSLASTEYVTTGHFKKVNQSTTKFHEEIVFGGDTMCQRTYATISNSVVATDLTSVGATQDAEGNPTYSNELVNKHPYRDIQIDFSNDGTNEAFGSLPNPHSPDMYSTAMAIMYSFNRINSQSRTKNPSELYWSESHHNPAFPFGGSLGNALFHRFSYHRNLVINASYLAGVNGYVFTDLIFRQFPYLNSRLSTSVNGFQGAPTLSELAGFDVLLMNNSYLFSQGQFVVGYANESTTRFRKNLPTRIYYSSLKDNNTVIDSYRIFNEFNFKDLDVIYGPINHIEILNGDVYSWQPDAMSRLFMLGTTAITGTESETEILLSQDKIFNKKEKVISNYGTSEKWSVALGRTKEGLSVCVWIDEKSKKIIRFDERQSIAIISDLFGISEPVKLLCDGMGDYELANPCNAGGAHTVWDEENGEFIFTWKYNFDGVESNVITYLTTDGVTASFGTDDNGDYELGDGLDDPFGELDTNPEDVDDIEEEEDITVEDTDDTTFDEDIEDIESEGDVFEEVNPDDDVAEEDNNTGDDGVVPGGDEGNPDIDTDATTGIMDGETGGLDEGNDPTTPGPTTDPIPGPHDEHIHIDDGTVRPPEDGEINPHEDPDTQLPDEASGERFAEFKKSINTLYSNNVEPRYVDGVLKKYFNKEGKVIGSDFTVQKLLKSITRFTQSNTRPTNKRSKQPVHKSSTNTARQKTILRNIIDTYLVNTSTGDFNRSLSKSATGGSRNAFNSTGTIKPPLLLAEAFAHFDFTRTHSLVESTAILSPDTTSDNIENIIGLDKRAALGNPIFKNSNFDLGKRYWQGFVQDSTCAISFVLNTCKLSAASNKYAGIRAQHGVPAESVVSITTSPVAGSTIALKDSNGNIVKYKAVDQTSAGAVDATKTGVFDKTDRTVTYERGNLETGVTAQRTQAAKCLTIAINSRSGHSGFIKAYHNGTGINLVQTITGSSGNTSITTTGTHNTSSVSFQNGVGSLGDVMPGFGTSARRKRDGVVMTTPFSPNTLYKITLDIDINTTTHSSAEIYFSDKTVGTVNDHTTVLKPISLSDLNNGHNHIVRYMTTSPSAGYSPTTSPNIGVYIKSGEMTIKKFQIREVKGRHLKISDITNTHGFKLRSIQSGNALQTVNAAAASETFDSNNTYPTYNSLPSLDVDEVAQFKKEHTIAIVVNANSATSQKPLFSMTNSANGAILWSLQINTTTQRYNIVASDGSLLLAIDDSRINNPNRLQFTGYVGGHDNVIILSYSQSPQANRYRVHSNGHTLSNQTFDYDYASVVPQFTFHADGGSSAGVPCIKEFAVTKKAYFVGGLGSAISGIFSYYSNKYNIPLHVDVLANGNTHSEWANLLTFTNLGTDAYIAPTGNILSKTRKEVKLGGSITIASNASTGSGVQDVFFDATPRATDSQRIFVSAKSFVKVISFSGGGVGTTNGPDAITLRLQPVNNHNMQDVQNITYKTTKVVNNILDTSQAVTNIVSSTYELETTFSCIRTDSNSVINVPVDVRLDAVRTAAVTTATLRYEIAGTIVQKAVNYSIPTNVGGKPVFAKVINTTDKTTKIYKKTSTALASLAVNIDDMATQTLPSLPANSVHWDQIGDTLINDGNWARLSARADSTSGEVINDTDDIEDIISSFTNATLSWNEFRKKFVSYYSYVPNIYMPFKDSFMSYDKSYNTTSGMNIWQHGLKAAQLGTFYGVNEKSSIFIPLNEVRENQKTLYNVILEGIISNVTDINASIIAVNPEGSDYKLMDLEVACDIDRKDDYYTLTPQGRIHGKAFAIKIETLANATAYVKVNSIIVRCRAEGPTRNLLSKQNPLTSLMRKQQRG